MKYYLIAGEASGDLHGSNLIKALKIKDPEANIRCWGGHLMQEAGGHLVKHYKELAFMGFLEVAKNIRTILQNIRFCKEDIASFQPDAIILIDYPGFNLRIAQWAHGNSWKVIYYIAPQVWAWKENRVPKMKKSIDKMLTILPFEKAYFKDKWNWDVCYVGHPLAESIEKYKTAHSELQPQKIIALLPGSRKQEILKKLPVMLQVQSHFPDYKFYISKAPGMDASFYQPFLDLHENFELWEGKTYDLLMQSKAALVTSGTATLETALFHIPEVVCYKGSNVSYQIAKRLVKVKYISLVNLIMDKLVVKELIQNDLTVEHCTEELQKLLSDTTKRQQLQTDYAQLTKLLLQGGNASENAAQEIWNTLH